MVRNTRGLWLGLFVGSLLTIKVVLAADDVPAAGASTIEVRVSESGSGTPIDEAAISGTINKKIAVGKTDGEGIYRIARPAGAIDNLSVNVAKPGFVPLKWNWRKGRAELPTVMNFSLEKATSVGGVIQDEAGQPIAGATVSLILPNRGNAEPRPRTYENKATTNAQGQWHIDALPASASDIWIRIAHQDYISDEMYNTTPRPPLEKLRDRTGVMVMRRGISVSGRVLDDEGQPIAAATVRQGHDRFGTHYPETKTNDAGEFKFAQVKPGQLLLTVQAAGRSPDLKDVDIADKPVDNIEFRLAKGHTLRGKVVNADGKPIAGAFISADTWRQHRSLEWRVDTDAEGRFEWKDAPDDEILMSLGKQGYMSGRHYRLKASDEEQTIVLNRPLEIVGRVVDDSTGKPVEKFTVIRGIVFENNNGPYWQRRESQDGADGKFSITFTEPQNMLLARVEELGYAPAASIGGVVRDAGGNPLGGVPIWMGSGRSSLQISNGQVVMQDATQTKSAADGTFELPAQDESYVLVAMNDDGVAEATQAEFEANRQLTLKRWGRIVGSIKLGQHGPNAKVAVNAQRTHTNSGANVFIHYSSVCDGEGKYTIERVVPGPAHVALTDEGKRTGNGMTITRHLRSVPVEVEPGQTVTADIGGEGRRVTAQLVNKDGSKPTGWNPTGGNLQLKSPFEKLPYPENWAMMSRQDKEAWLKAFIESPEGQEFARQQRLNTRNIPVAIEPDGSVLGEAVPPGTYRLASTIFSTANEMIGRTNHEVVVPAAADKNSDEPVNLGDIPIEPHVSLAIGAAAPEIEAETVAGEPFKLGGLKGKFVLLDFWATWCGPCIAEIPHLRDVYDSFGKDERFALVSLSLDNERKTAADYVEAQEIKWTQVHLGEWAKSETPNKYGVLGIPAVFLIGPDGKVIARNLRGDAIKTSVAAALAEPAAKPSSGKE